ncbi:DEAD/DEAH box helicase [Clostridium sporogenes]|uniref:DEAD/DEAH box helicase n=1 Tax=Clostridium botulinum TaxID=1491 RepID=A0A6M0T5D7_CLOBO|nr:DEAD/DEAH box helicase [Clostridium sporogenes]NFA61972.1 DEAD/DEAH box helicase [Clostridium botulinum]NFI75026.1 DEAD/DEAH box helicase [Clostridium sporogenes]NFM25950.1 DEAD/DEAH box helicase [Clostridium sporogenes]NFP63152.1 DEAD/DEAH box helicase [Clostridium sporogenes]NFU94002.1 DEAD/DEAH box helicase [Clostridium sporogenes]
MMNSFDTLNLNPMLVEGLKKLNINEPTEIQKRAIPLAMENRDIIGQSETGTGKTLAYLLPIFEKVNVEKKEMQTIILAPTHELSMQINNEIKNIASNSNMDVRSMAIIGEANIKRQIEKLKEKPHIIVGSPGRILELIKKKKITAHTVKTIVIDEGDKLLDKNNIKVVKDIIKTTLKERQLMLFSATITESSLNIAKDLMKEAEVIKVKEQNTVNENIKHLYITGEHRERIEVLRKLIASTNPKRAIVFINRNEEIELITLKLQYHKIKAYGIYGAAEKEQRKKALEDFRLGKVQILVSSDLSARGLDIKDVTHIFNLDLPENPKEYLHRVGRTGRASEEGTAISIITEKEKALIRKYEKEFNINIEEKKIYKGTLIDSKGEKNSQPKSKNKFTTVNRDNKKKRSSSIDKSKNSYKKKKH